MTSHSSGKTIVTPRNREWLRDIGVKPRKVEDPAFQAEYPFTSRRVQINGHWLHYVDEGDGEPIVMVHGNPTWSFFYRGLVKGLRDKYRCIAVDHLGCGFSEKPKKYEYTLRHHIDNLEGVIHQALPADQQFTLVVHDWGGPIGCGYAVRHPERIARLVVLNTSASVEGDMPRRIKLCRRQVLGPLLVRGLNGFAGFATRMTTVHPLSRPLRKMYVLPYNSWANRIAIQRFVADIPLDGQGETYDILADIEQKLPTALADTPVLIQWGMKDWCFTPFFLDLWKARFPNATVKEYSEAGHYILEDAGDDIVVGIRGFLRRNTLINERPAE